MSPTDYIKLVGICQPAIQIKHDASVISLILDIHPGEDNFVVVFPGCNIPATGKYFAILVPCDSWSWHTFCVTSQVELFALLIT